MATLNMSTENLILEGIRNTHSWQQVIRGLGDVESVLVPTGSTDAHFRLDLTEEEQEILANVNGRATVEQICDMSYLSNFETCRILWALQVLAHHPAGAGRGDGRPGRGRPRAAARAGPRGHRREVQPDVQPDLRLPARAAGRLRRRLHGRVPGGGLAAVRRALRRRGPEAIRARRLRADAGQRGRPAPRSSARASWSRP